MKPKHKKTPQGLPATVPCENCGKLPAIIKGFGRLTWERITKGKPDNETVRRSAICAACEHRTFLSVTQWAIEAVHKGDLPINHEPSEWDALWCSRCKCCIEAKIRVAEEQCPLGRWVATADSVEKING